MLKLAQLRGYNTSGAATSQGCVKGKMSIDEGQRKEVGDTEGRGKVRSQPSSDLT
jgi:hypothetical protein